MMKRLGWWVVLISLVLLVSACGGGGGGGDDDNGNDNQPENASATGLWFGTLTDGQDMTYDIAGIVTPDNEIWLFSPDLGTIYVGTITVDGNSGNGTFTAYASDFTFGNGQAIAPGTLQFLVAEKSNLSGTYSLAGDNGTFAMEYDPEGEGAIPLANQAGSWGYVIDPETVVAIDLEANGSFTGGNAQGCIFQGTVFIPDTDWNIYDAFLQISSCGEINGSYDGVTTILDAGDFDIMLFIGANGFIALFDAYLPLE